MLRTRFRTRARFIPALSGGGLLSITNSLRFNDNDSAYLNRTQIAGDEKKFTVSFWIKRGNLVNGTLFAASNLSSFTDRDNESINFLNDKIIWGAQKKVGGGAFIFAYSVETQALLRDVSGWYHVVVAKDLNQASASDRIKIYINGVLQTLNIINAVGTEDTAMNRAGEPAYIGYLGTAAPNHYDGYMAEVNFIDGQQLTPDDFGEINADTGEWSPKKYSGTYGTNGFYLPFDGNANDDSGNGNNWTENNLASTDYMIDTPTNNFSVFNPLDPNTTATLSEGNLKTVTPASGGIYGAYGTIGVSSGKWYIETTLNGFIYSENGVAGGSGLINSSNRADLVGAFFSAGSSAWAVIAGTTSNLAFTGSSVGDVMNIAIDLDVGRVWIGKNGVWNGSGNPDTGANPDGTFTPSGTYRAYAEPYRDGIGYWWLTANFGADSSFAGIKTRQGNTDANGIGDFYYEPPAGFLALCEDNLELIPFVATGGTETTITDGGVDYKVHTFTSSDTLYVQGIGEVEYLVVAGGGGGGAYGGGGGAGGYRSSVVGESSGGGASAEPKLAVSAGSYTVTVGAGGAGAPEASSPNSVQGSDGQNSVFGSITSIGGGGGASGESGNSGRSGGSGGGGSSNGSGAGGSGTVNQGYAGASSTGTGGGGGGGAGAVGTVSDGGIGISSSITGSSTTKASGGGADGGVGQAGGGNGGITAVPGTAGTSATVNSGSGGGGGGILAQSPFTRRAGGNGGSGIVIIRYAV